jgi:S-layer homology domain
MWWCERGNNHIARITVGPLAPTALAVDPSGNNILEVGETVAVVPTWKNNGDAPQPVTGTASNFTGPAGPTYTITNSSADYGSIGAGASTDCQTATGNCYSVHITAASRPAAHWDTTINETLSDNTIKGWTLHVGGSFTDVPTSQQFYAFIENIFHNGITGGCAEGLYCPTNSVTRAQMAVFLLKSKHGEDYLPPTCTGIFADVPCPSQFANWIEELSIEGTTSGCGGGDYCPSNPVTRAQMAAFLLKEQHGSGYMPPACTGIFGDVPCPSQFANWIEELSIEGITGGCGGGDYCPNNPNTRGQMAVFLVKTFNLLIYGP